MDNNAELNRTLYNSQAAKMMDAKRKKVYTQAYKKIVDRIGIDDGWSLLDIGCGTGTFAIALEGRADYVGIDVSNVAISCSKSQHLQRSVFLCEDFLEWETSIKFDAIVAITAIDQFEDRLAVLKKINQLLNDSGVVYVEVRSNSYIR